jgi:hypothetical protein
MDILLSNGIKNATLPHRYHVDIGMNGVNFPSNRYVKPTTHSKFKRPPQVPLHNLLGDIKTLLLPLDIMDFNIFQTKFLDINTFKTLFSCTDILD